MKSEFCASALAGLLLGSFRFRELKTDGFSVLGNPLAQDKGTRNYLFVLNEGYALGLLQCPAYLFVGLLALHRSIRGGSYEKRS